jgi:hypothetical protein
LSVDLGISPPDLLETPPAVLDEMVRYYNEQLQAAKRKAR